MYLLPPHYHMWNKQIALFSTLATFTLTLVVWSKTDQSLLGYHLCEEMGMGVIGKLGGVGITLAIDGVSLTFLLITSFLFPICLLASWDSILKVKIINGVINFYDIIVVICTMRMSFRNKNMMKSERGRIELVRNSDRAGEVVAESARLNTDKGPGIDGTIARGIGVKSGLASLLVLEMLLIALFITTDLIAFYILFESILLPMLFMIGVWGGDRKVAALSYFFLYTLVGSLLMLLAILDIAANSGSTSMVLLEYPLTGYSRLIWVGIFMALWIKTPLVPFHLWLPLAHSEAPLAGSILLAGVMIKLALYGFLRIMLPILPEASHYFSPFVYALSAVTILFCSLATLRQIDLKQIIAYSSIGHMGVSVMGIFSNKLTGLEGGVLLAIAHGISSPALFILVTVLYDRYHSRLLRYYRGMAIHMPMFVILLFIFTLCNIAVPISSNYVGEFLSLLGAYQFNLGLTAIASTSVFLTACYAIWLFNRVSYGYTSSYLLRVKELTRSEYHTLMPLLVVTVALGVFPDPLVSVNLAYLCNVLN